MASNIQWLAGREYKQMFTGKSTTLANIATKLGLSLLRDCEFQYVGKIPTRLNNRIVSCSKESHIRDALNSPGISGVITSPDLADQIPEEFGLLLSLTPQADLYRAHSYLCKTPGFYWEDFNSEIDASATICPGAIIAPKNVRIGEGTVIHSGAIIGERTIIGAHCSIGPGTVISSDAFEVQDRDNALSIIDQAGGVRIGNSVDVQALTTIIRSTFGGFTEIGDQTKIDCHVHIAHDCYIGRRVKITACAEVSGRVQIGDEAYLGPNCCISNGITIGKRAFITMGSVVVKNVLENQKVTGNFALPHLSWIRFIKSIK